VRFLGRNFAIGTLILAIGLALASCGVLYGIDIAADDPSGPAPHTVNFTSDTDGYVGIIHYYWDFDDGGDSAAEDPTHTFTEAGFYTVTCEATNEETVVSTSIQIEVTE